MSTEAFLRFRSLEGRRVRVALPDGSRMECQLVSASRPGRQTVRLFVDGIDVFLPATAIVACWEVTAPLARRAA